MVHTTAYTNSFRCDGLVSTCVWPYSVYGYISTAMSKSFLLSFLFSDDYDLPETRLLIEHMTEL